MAALARRRNEWEDTKVHFLAVVPLVVSGGAAVLPAVVAAVASVAAMVFNPRALVRLLRRRWLASSVVLGAMVLCMVAAVWWWRSESPVRRAGRNTPHEAGRIDWAKVAEEIIAQERAREKSGNAAALAADPPARAGGPVPAAQGAPGLTALGGQDFSRVLYRGGPSPAGLIALWSFKPEGTVFFGVPAIAGKRVYAAGCQSDLGGYTGLLACLDLDSGKPLWQTIGKGRRAVAAVFQFAGVVGGREIPRDWAGFAPGPGLFAALL